MKTLLSLAVLGTIVLTSGCYGTANLNGPHSTVSGTGNTAELGLVAAYYDTSITNAQTHQLCVLSGKCFGYGGGIGTDQELYYRNTGRRTAPATTQPQPAAANGSQPQTQPVAAVDECARQKADNALRAASAIDNDEDIVLPGTPACTKEKK